MCAKGVFPRLFAVKLENIRQQKKGGPMGLKIFGAFAALLLVAACETAPEAMMDADGGGAAMAAMTPSPITAQPTRPLAWPEPPIVPGSSNEFVKVVGDRVFFGFDQFSLTERAQESLKRQAEWLNLYPLVKIVVQQLPDCIECGRRPHQHNFIR
jgi:peptidoglycan-associated lipoprotein